MSVSGDNTSPRPAGTVAQPGAELLVLYDRALPAVYGYLLTRCRDVSVAEDLTSETFLAAVRGGAGNPQTVGWLIGIARHKLADHWRWKARQDRLIEAIGDETAGSEDPWDTELDVLHAHEVLSRLGPHHRLALTLRHLDGLSVPQTAAALDRTVHATEALLVRARQAFRREYEGSTR
jgi:RNA polymerase sigma-70 factor (ECF subfamily)